jgi:hypothetical protein
MIELLLPMRLNKYDTWRILPMKCNIGNSVRLHSSIRNINTRELACCYIGQAHSHIIWCEVRRSLHVVTKDHFRSVLLLLRFPHLGCHVHHTVPRYSPTIPHSSRARHIPKGSLISEQVIPYLTCDGTCCHGGLLSRTGP